MENEEDKAYPQHQKWKKRTKSAGFPSNSMQDLNFTIPLLPAEFIPLEIQFETALMYGFGYDDFHDDYKLLGTFCRKGKFGRGELKIYSLKSDSWGSVDDCQLRKCKSREEVYISGILVKGKLHWPNAKVNGSLSDYKEWNIISFDLANEKWGEVEHPFYKEGYIHLYLGVLGSDLSIFCDNAASHVDFWVMKEYGVKQSWTKMFTVNYSFDTHLPCFMSNKGEFFFRFVKYSMIYKPKDSSLRYSEVIDFDEFPEIAIYVESLVCPFSKEEAADATKHKRLKKLQSRKPSDKELAGIGSSRQAEATDSVQLAVVSQQIAQLTRAVAQSIAQNEVTRKTVEELKKQMVSMPRRRRRRSPSPDSSSEEETESDEEFVGSTP
ncbi:hypothetical protein CQW23_22646 [Capsicum baccatum]|uniref:F-box associated beta-propeller type 1 domain-containing protein n=1 Tax=Capsicum baccatum TaxID=33114 RepID=A0A2G2W1K3_CAPBA|nr:hypothetical protein CQW23_22646 [Capsicum baccatum]